MTKFGAIVALTAALPALAGTLTTTQNVSLWGRSYSVKSYNVASDLAISGTRMEPEAMTFYNGKLYVAGDRDTAEARGQLAIYNAGDLTSATVIQMGTALDGANLQQWGPEGITVNTSGSGYGSFTSGPGRLVGVEGAGRDRGAVINLADNTVTDVVGNAPQVFGNYDDIAFSSSADAFFVINGDSAASPILRLNKNTLAIESTLSTSWGAANAKGLTVVSKAFAELLTGASVSTAQAFIVALKDGVGTLGFNRLVVVDLDGNIIGDQQAFNLSGLALTSEIEAIAVDEATNTIFVGDEGARSVHTFVIPAPGAATMLGMGGLILARRRRA